MNEQIKKTIEELETLESKIFDLEVNLTSLKDDYKKLKDVDLVCFLQEAGLSKVSTIAGDTIEIKTAMTVSQKDKNLVARWCEKVGYKEAIKTNFEFEKGSELGGVEDKIKEVGLKYSKKEEVNTMTLKKLVKEIYDFDGSLPGDDSGMNISLYTYADIKGKKDE